MTPQTLSQAVSTFLGGKAIDEDPAGSDWSVRPLTDAQKIYAAIQAHALLEIASAMRRKAKDGGFECAVPMQP